MSLYGTALAKSIECNIFEQCMLSELSLGLLVVKPESDWVGVVCARSQLNPFSEHIIRTGIETSI
jgi:hypothetical protein